ncbi:MAG TPA: VOC family protein [Fimbriimonadaceae bacterium]|nr:VOC family protein [Fimbriimonadaceae bacterium]
MESDLKETKPWSAAGIPEGSAILGIDGVALCLEGYERTARLLHDRMNYRNGPHEGCRYRFIKPQHHIGGWVDLLCQPDAPRGRVAVGSIHHIAFRVENDQKQRMYRISLVDDHYNVSPVLDRNYFHSIYFREPGGVLFEIATDAPGFGVDEDLSSLGERLCLPPMYESRRSEIEAALPALG